MAFRPWLRHQRPRASGFTLIELLVALAAMAVMAGLSWRGIDGMSRAQLQIRQHADAVLTLQAGLAQWNADLDGLVQLPQTPTLDWDGRGLRIVRRGTEQQTDSGVRVVAWSRRSIDGVDQWLRWQSPPQRTRGELAVAWLQAGQWAQNPGDAEKRNEVVITPLAGWQIFYFRGNAWTNPLSSDNAAAPAVPEPGKPAVLTTALPDGVRLVLSLPAGQPLSGSLTRDWIRPAVGSGK